ncbi:site-specific integrase [Flavobacteriaceae bacterium KMM 6898]|nr:site-specific integrase [Flavobacteriaceae bacterium KMM 6898]
MGSIKFIIKGSSNPSTIYIRFRHGRKFDFIKSTSLLINPKYWNNTKGVVKQISEFTDKRNLQNKLNDLNSHVLNQFNDVYTDGGVITSDWFNDCIKGFFNQNEGVDFNYFLDFADYYYKTLPSKVQRSGKIGVAGNTLKRYQTIFNKVKEYEKFTKKRLRITEVDLKFYKEFKNFLNVKQQLNHNTTGRYLIYIKTICLEAKKYGLKVNPEVEREEFRQTKEKTDFITLSENEIQHIFEYDFNENPYLDNARNWLIIGVWTGARVSDLLSFAKRNLTGNYLEYTAVKTGQKIVLPLHPNVRTILTNNNGEFPNSISSQKFNNYIKQVCKKAGINEEMEGAKKIEIEPKIWRKQSGTFEKWELVSSHICRRSFATNHYGKLPTPVIMAVTGHATEKMFLTYIGKTSKDSAIQLQQYWNRVGD